MHPDKLKNPSEDDKNRYMDVAHFSVSQELIVKAYETLSDPEKRRVYDMGGSDVPFW